MNETLQSSPLKRQKLSPTPIPATSSMSFQGPMRTLESSPVSPTVGRSSGPPPALRGSKPVSSTPRRPDRLSVTFAEPTPKRRSAHPAGIQARQQQIAAQNEAHEFNTNVQQPITRAFNIFQNTVTGDYIALTIVLDALEHTVETQNMPPFGLQLFDYLQAGVFRALSIKNAWNILSARLETVHGEELSLG
ncbi:hypothetical protein BYT27DRAFT_7219760 [Phlegmacium glaucopus]|nr:hypothetical protein BYT27DRAFT_7219760 [Phlegmacium glaucopus]